ncbi:MAG: arginine deiminase-related protein [Planctomycetota bacterium]
MNRPPTILMCPPEHYGIEYEINPWMSTKRQVDHALAVEQWRALRALLIELGASIRETPPVKGWPDLVFTANAALIFHERALLSRFKHPQRQGEEPYYERSLRKNGFEVIRTQDDFSFEGAGDALFCGDTLYAGYRLRSDAGGHQQIGESLGVRVLPLELVNPYYYHLDTCFCPLSPTEAIYFPDAFDEYGKRVLSESIPNLIEVEESEACSFACNAVVVGRSVVTNSGCSDLHEKLRRAGYKAFETPLSEFVKAGGSAKCLTLRLDGEEAAAWRQPPTEAVGRDADDERMG